MTVHLPFTNENDKPLPGGWCYLAAEKGEVSDSCSGGSRTANPVDTIDRHTHFRMASVSKQYTAAAILLCEKIKKLNRSDPIGCYLNLPPHLSPVTIQQLLDHTSGITDYETLIPTHQEKQLTDKDVYRLIQKQGTTYFTPGNRFRYSNTGYCLLAVIIEEVSQISFAAFMDHYIFKPAGLSTTTVYEQKKDIPNRAYGFKIKKDQAVFADQNIMSATQGDGGIYTSPLQYKQWIEKLFSGKIIADYAQQLFKNKVAVKDNVSYNMGWFISEETDGTHCVFHSGESTGFRNMVYYNPDKKLLILYFSDREDDANMAKVIDRLMQKYEIQLKIKESVIHWMSKVYSMPFS